MSCAVWHLTRVVYLNYSQIVNWITKTTQVIKVKTSPFRICQLGILQYDWQFAKFVKQKKIWYFVFVIGLSFTELYSKCRERFLVNSDLTLRAQLTEFKDHKLIKTKKVSTCSFPPSICVCNKVYKRVHEYRSYWGILSKFIMLIHFLSFNFLHY